MLWYHILAIKFHKLTKELNWSLDKPRSRDLRGFSTSDVVFNGVGEKVKMAESALLHAGVPRLD